MIDGPGVRIHYHRPPDRHDVFEQAILHRPDGPLPGDPAARHGRLADGWVTFLPEAAIREPMTVDDTVVLEPGAPIVWLTFPGAWHDIGRFHTRDGRFTGYYANVLTPVRIEGDDWHTTDLFLDVFLPHGGTPRILDAAELDHALAGGWVDAPTASRARAEADRIVAMAREGAWPPRLAVEWTLDRALDALPG